jgi:hypothetical protein
MKTKERIALEKLFDKFASECNCENCLGTFVNYYNLQVSEYYRKKYSHTCGVCMELFPKLRTFHYRTFTFSSYVYSYSMCMCHWCSKKAKRFHDLSFRKSYYLDFQKATEKSYRYINGYWS